jgi:hypothetical protein
MAAMNLRQISRRVLLLGVAVLALAGSAVHAADWGSVKGRFVYKGTPKNEKIQVNKDTEYCSQHNPIVETVTVGDDGGLENVFVYLVVPRGKKATISPSYKTEGLEPKVLDNHFCRFEPHGMTVWTAEPFEIHNDDPIGHNTNGQNIAVNTKFNETVAQGTPIKKQFTKNEPTPTVITCSIHPWMNAVILIRDNPYMAVSGKDGSFEIKDLPAGPNDFTLWHEARGYLKELKVGSDKADRKGQVKVKIPAGDVLDLGDIEVTPDNLGQ